MDFINETMPRTTGRPSLPEGMRHHDAVAGDAPLYLETVDYIFETGCKTGQIGG